MRIQSGPICVQLPPATRAKRVFTIHHLPVYPSHRESPKRLEGTPGKQKHRNDRFHRAEYHHSATLQTNLQPELFYDSMMFYLTLIRLRGQQIHVCMKMQFKIYQDIKHFNPKEGSAGFFSSITASESHTICTPGLTAMEAGNEPVWM